MSSKEIRQRFTEFFIKQNHKKISSSSLIPQNDPTLLFANAGMNQFKDIFTGKSTAPYKRAVTIQKCVRAGGKHNDLENVGLTARHHTFFEMLGNFSFGDYFKEEAIKMAWELLTIEFKIPKEKLYITVHHSDDEALQIWNKKIGISLDRIFKKGDKDNFWEMGELGPCGPCSEIFFDHGPAFSKKGLVLKEGQDLLDDDERYVEIWNLVFMQYEKTPEGRTNLPRPSIDTGAGLERVTAAIQGKYWNYDTDLFAPIINELEKRTGKKYSDPKYTSSMRIIADHIRAATMLITDGALPSNEGRGYVLRRIIRRAIRHLKDLNAGENYFHKLVPLVFEGLGNEYPENKNNQSLSEKILLLEEKKFSETLDHGLKFLEDAISKISGKDLPALEAFKLYDTYGFPLDLTQIILQEKGLTTDVNKFEKIMQERKEESRKTWKGGVTTNTKAFYELKEKYGDTVFTGYENCEQKAKLVDKITAGEKTLLFFDKTPFYAESGGQLGDVGVVKSNNVILSSITDTQKPVEGLHAHCSSDSDLLEIGESYILSVDESKRALTERNHSATHLLQSALIKVLGDHIKQAGSNVGPERLRFDFTHIQAVSPTELQEVERIVNEQIRKSLPVCASVMNKNDAVKKGAMALFGEKYGDQVRVLEMGNFSTELCGGTHVKNTRDIGAFIIISENSLSTGIRRIEAMTSVGAQEYLKERSLTLKRIERVLSLPEDKVFDRVESLLQDLRIKNKEIESLNQKIQNIESRNLFENPQTLKNDIKFIVVKAPDGADLRKLSDIFVSKFEKAIIVAHLASQDKVNVLIRTNLKESNLNCGTILKEVLAAMDGRGGGKPDMAQGSGSLSKLAEGLDLANKLVMKNI